MPRRASPLLARFWRRSSISRRFHSGKLANTRFPDSAGFRLAHSIDNKCGGFFNNLGADGSVYDTTKQMWLHCREVWMLSKLCVKSGELENKAEVLKAATHGAEFIRKFA